MANVSVKIKLNSASVRALLRDGAVVGYLEGKAAAIAAAAGSTGGQFGHDARVGGNRARATVWTADFDARHAEATDRALTRAVDAGRG